MQFKRENKTINLRQYEGHKYFNFLRKMFNLKIILELSQLMSNRL